jgi:hypothetical protein
MRTEMLCTWNFQGKAGKVIYNLPLLVVFSWY